MKSQDVFKQNPKLESYFQTSDGNNFFKDFDAKNHAKSLKNKAIKEVKKGDSKAVLLSSQDAQLSPEEVKKINDIKKLVSIEAVKKALEKETSEAVKIEGAKKIEAIKGKDTK